MLASSAAQTRPRSALNPAKFRVGVEATAVGPSNTPENDSEADRAARTRSIDRQQRAALLEQSVLRDAVPMSHRALSALAPLVLFLGACASFGALSLAAPSRGEAQARPSATILRTHVGDGASEATGRGFDRVLRQRLDALEVAQVAGSVELDLESVQLALGCMGESAECLRAAATQAGAEILVFASIESSGSLVVSVMRFDAADGRLRRAVRTVDSEAAVLEAAEPLARELWDLPPVVEQADPVITPVTPSTPSISPGPLVLVGLGGAAVIVGAVLLGHASYLGDLYRTANPRTMAEVDQANAALSGSQDESLVGTVLLAAGGAIAIAGTIWLLAAGNDDGSSPLAVVPFVSPDGVSLSLAGTLPGGGF